MKIPVQLLLLGTLLSLPAAVIAQTVGVSNLNVGGAASIYSTSSRVNGMAFTTDNSAASFTLNSVTLAFTSFPSGAVNGFGLSIRAYDGATSPGAVLGTLTNGALPVSGTDAYASTGINKTWTTSGITLLASTTYFVTWGFSSGGGAYNAAIRSDTASTGAWSFADNSITSTNSGTSFNPLSGRLMMDVSASAVPEPSSYPALAGLAVLGFAATRRRRRT